QDRLSLVRGGDGVFRTYGSDEEGDATLVLLRRTELPDAVSAECLAAIRTGRSPREAGLHGHFVVRVALAEMEDRARGGDIVGLEACLEYLARSDLVPTRERLLVLADRLVDDGTEQTRRTFRRIVEIAREADD
ncbi:MAG: hypothetical protein R6X25_05070, partial [Candidatus Krumholzibacteriia bacterium]